MSQTGEKVIELVEEKQIDVFFDILIQADMNQLNLTAIMLIYIYSNIESDL